MVVPAAGAINEPGRVKLPHAISKSKFGIAINKLAPAFIIDNLRYELVFAGRKKKHKVRFKTHPSPDTGVALQLVDEEVKLAGKFRLLLGVGHFGDRQRRHVLDNKQAHLVACLVKQGRLNFDLFSRNKKISVTAKRFELQGTGTYMLPNHVETKFLQHLQIVNHSLSVRRGMETIRPVTLIKGCESEDELAIYQRSHNPIDNSLGDGSESGVTVNFIGTHPDSDVVEVGCIWRP